MTIVIDASATLAIVFEERGADVALAHCRSARLCAVNLDEVLHKSMRRNIAASDVETQLSRLEITVIPFDAAHARVAADISGRVQGTSTSFADRACLALAIVTQCPVLTADQDWQNLGLDIDIRLIR